MSEEKPQNEAKPTKGPWTFYDGKVFAGIVRIAEADGEHDSRIDQCVPCANARLIAEAGTVYSECGLTPRELAARLARYMTLFPATAQGLEEDPEECLRALGYVSRTQLEALESQRAELLTALQSMIQGCEAAGIVGIRIELAKKAYAKATKGSTE